MAPETTRTASWVAGFLVYARAEGLSPCTIADYSTGLRHFARWLGDRDPLALSTAELRGFFATLRDVPNGRGGTLSPKTVRNAWAALRSFYRWLADETSTPNPMLAVQMPKAVPPVIEPLSRAQIAALLKACDQTRAAVTHGRDAFAMSRDTAKRDRAIVLVLLDSGLRASELCALTVADVDVTTGYVLVKRGKGGKGRITYIGKQTRRALWRYLSSRKTTPAEPLFVARTGHPLDRDRLGALLANLGDRAGVPDVHPHRLRHTFATEFLRNGGNLLALQRLLGHSSLEMVRRYATIAESDLQRAHEAGSPADQWRL